MGGCNAIATEHGRYGLSCMRNMWSAQAMLSEYGICGNVNYAVKHEHGRISCMWKAVE